MKKSKLLSVVRGVILLGLMLAGSVAQAAIISPDGVSSSDTVARYNTSLNYTIDESGLDTLLATATESTVGSISHGLGFAASIQFVDTFQTTGTFDFTFNSAVDLKTIYVWNYTQNVALNSGVGAYEVYIDTGSGYGATAVVSGSLVAATYTAGSHFAQSIDLGGTQAGVVGFRIVASNLGGTGIGFDEVAVSTDVVSPSTLLLLSPDNQLPMDQLSFVLAAPATLSTGTVDVAFAYGNDNYDVQITSVAVIDQQHSGAFSVVGFTTPQTLSDPFPTNIPLNIEFDLTGTGLSDGQSSTGVVEIVWNEIGGDTFTNTLPVNALYDSPPAELILANSLEMILAEAATSISSNLTVSYTPENLAPADVEITAVLFTNESHSGFSCSTVPPTLTLNGAVPTNTLSITFDNTSAGLNEKETATATAQVIWNEAGHVDSYTNTVSVSVFRAGGYAPATVVKNTAPADSDVLSAGVVAAINWGPAGATAGSAVDVTVNGVDFTSSALTSGGAVDVTYGSGLGVGLLQVSSSFAAVYADFDASDPDIPGDINTIFNSVAVGPSAANIYHFDFTDLVEGTFYSLQLFFSSAAQDRAQDIYQVGNASPIASWSNLTDTQTSITISWVATASGTESFYFSPTVLTGTLSGFVYATGGSTIANTASIQLGAGSGGDLSVNASNLTSWATYILQSTESLVATNWVDIATTSGVTEVNWDSVIVPTNNAEFFRVILE